MTQALEIRSHRAQSRCLAAKLKHSGVSASLDTNGPESA